MAKTVVVTGGTKGIGLAIVYKFAKEGFDVITCSRNEENIQSLKTAFANSFPNVKLMVVQADLSLKKDTNVFLERVLQQTDQIDVLVNNTGMFVPGEVHNEEEGLLEKMIETNLYSAYRVTRGLIDVLIQQKGYVFNVCSTASIVPYVNGGSYCISKFALYGMNKVLREEMKDKGVRVTAILPGATFTSSWAESDLPAERFMKPEDVAETIFSAYSLSSHSVVEEIIVRPQLGDI